MNRLGKTAGCLAGFVMMAVLMLPLLSCFGPFASEEQLSIAGLESRVFTIVNEYRVSKGLKALVWNDAMADEERAHSQAMASGQFPVGHQGFEERIARINKIIPWSLISENVASAINADAALEAWLRSPDHKVIIEGDYDLTGVGVAKDPDGPLIYFSQMFLKPY